MAQKFKFSIGTALIPIVVIIIVFLLAFGSSFIAIIDAGTVGVQVTFGSVSNDTFDAGLHLKNPFTTIVSMPIRTQEYTMSNTAGEGQRFEDDSIKALTSDGSSVWLDVTVLYKLRPLDAPRIYSELGLDYSEKVIRPQIRSNIREVISQYGITQVYAEKREEIQTKLIEEISNALDPRGIEVEDVLLRDVVLTQALSDSIAQKLAAQQEAQKLDFEIEKTKKEAERQVIEATGQRDAQKIISQGLTNSYLYYLYLENLKNVEGTIYVPTDPGSGIPLFKGL